MNEIDKTNIDAQYWADEFCKRLPKTDNELLMGYFANYRFAISDPLNTKIELLEAELKTFAEMETVIQSCEHKWIDMTSKEHARNTRHEMCAKCSKQKIILEVEDSVAVRIGQLLLSEK